MEVDYLRIASVFSLTDLWAIQTQKLLKVIFWKNTLLVK